MNIEKARLNMIKKQVRISGIKDKKILRLLSRIPREDFVPENYKAFSFADMMIPLTQNKLLFSPFIEGKVLEAMPPSSADERVLVLGAQGCYLAAVFACLAKTVELIDDDETLIQSLAHKMESLDITNVKCTKGSLSNGWQTKAPYDVILISGTLETLPENYKAMLSAQGRLFAIIGQAPNMQGIVMTRTGKDTWTSKKLFETDIPYLTETQDRPEFEF